MCTVAFIFRLIVSHALRLARDLSSRNVHRGAQHQYARPSVHRRSGILIGFLIRRICKQCLVDECLHQGEELCTLSVCLMLLIMSAGYDDLFVLVCDRTPATIP